MLVFAIASFILLRHFRNVVFPLRDGPITVNISLVRTCNVIPFSAGEFPYEKLKFLAIIFCGSEFPVSTIRPSYETLAMNLRISQYAKKLTINIEMSSVAAEPYAISLAPVSRTSR